MLKRHADNPLITPERIAPSRRGYRVRGALNPGAVMHDGEILLLVRVAEDCEAEAGRVAVPYYRKTDTGMKADILDVGLDDPDVSRKDTRGIVYKGKDYLSTMSHIRLARSSDGCTFTMDPEPFLYPTCDAEQFGVEDARVTRIGDTYYINYTAVSADGYATALATTRDFVSLEKHGVIFPPPNKDVSIFPEKIHGRYAALHRPANCGFGLPSIWYAESDDLIAWGRHRCLLRPRRTFWEEQKIGGGAAPIRTSRGWLEIYHGKGRNQIYSLFAVLLDGDDPTRILSRGSSPLLRPEADYETRGFFGNVIFCNGVIDRGDGHLFIYYGACDESVCLAEASIDEILATMTP